MYFKRLSYRKEPRLKVHKYVVELINPIGGARRYKYCMNLDEVAEEKRSVDVHWTVNVFKVTHNYFKGWKRVK